MVEEEVGIIICSKTKTKCVRVGSEGREDGGLFRVKVKMEKLLSD
jgi:hypothetical protein